MKEGLITRSTGKWYKAAVDGETVDCRLPGKFRLREEEVTNPLAVGDRVTLRIEEDGTGTVEKIHERTNYLPRKATHSKRGTQILAANIDRGWVVVAVRKPKFKPGFIDRFLVICQAYEVPAAVIFNKTDLAGKKDRNRMNEMAELYRELGYTVHLTSIFDKKSIEALNENLKEKISVFIGPSGAGKSSLLNAIDPELNLRTADVSKATTKGRHTTTKAELVRLQNGGFIVDTPGIRELGLVNIQPYELSLFFPEMRPWREHCKFYNCTHHHEPGCGVVEAFHEGKIHPERYNSYLNILESLEEEE